MFFKRLWSTTWNGDLRHQRIFPYSWTAFWRVVVLLFKAQYLLKTEWSLYSVVLTRCRWSFLLSKEPGALENNLEGEQINWGGWPLGHQSRERESPTMIEEEFRKMKHLEFCVKPYLAFQWSLHDLRKTKSSKLQTSLMLGITVFLLETRKWLSLPPERMNLRTLVPYQGNEEMSDSCLLYAT